MTEVNPQQIDTVISELTKKEKITEKEARSYVGMFGAAPAPSGGAPDSARKGLGLGNLLRLGAVLLMVLKKIQTLAAGKAAVVTFQFLGQPRWLAVGTGTPPTIPGAE